jgi:hypothetical protein
VLRGTCASYEPAVMSATPDRSPYFMMRMLCRWTVVRDRRPHVVKALAHRCLLALGLAGDLGELEFCWSGAAGPCAWWSSLVVIGHCPATSDGPETAQLCRTRRRRTPLLRPV